ncbi:MAG: glyoxalase [Bacillati bacterium ANGP1]|uniref:Glyoxalase n=1 Tax=Candidatus Segetimicrobium genomatis TaxID=2569760 RepID=A0A537J146_9BACT|nr:MAG: glyoxalase [Terrabacteria group bacterium ANGP1]
MPIRRVVPNVKSDKFEESRSFYGDFLGFNVGMDLGWIITFVSPTNQTAQISILRSDQSGIHPNISIEVADVDAVHATAVARGLKIAYPLTDEPWGVRRFFVVDPNGLVLNILSHLART